MTRSPNGLGRAAAVLALLWACRGAAFAATLNWNGSANTNLSTAANWTPAQSPAAGDDLVLQGTISGSILTLNNDLAASVQLHSLTLNRLFFGNYVINGNSLELQGGGTITDENEDGTDVINCGIVVNGAATLATASNGTFELAGAISGSGGGVTLNNRSDGGNLIIAGACSYSGNTTISAGINGGMVAIDGSLPTGGGITTVSAGATLAGLGQLNGTVNISQDAFLAPGVDTPLTAQSPGAKGTLSGGVITWNGSSNGAATLLLDLSGSLPAVGRLNAVSFNRGSSGTYAISLEDTATTPGTTTLISFNFFNNFTGSDFSVTNLSLSNPPVTGTLAVVGGSLQLTVLGAPVLTSAQAVTATLGQPFTYTITSNETITGISASPLPAGLTLNKTTDVISGTPTTLGATACTVNLVNAGGAGSTTAVVFTVAAAAPGLAAATTSGTVGRAFSYQIPGGAGTTFAASGLPPGLSVDTSSGLISGTPTGGPKTYSVSVSATNSSGRSTAALTIAVDGGASSYTPFAFQTYAGQTAPGAQDGTGAAAKFLHPVGVAVDAVGNVYVADTGNHTIRKIVPGGAVTTFAGAPGSSGSIDGLGAAARFNLPQGAAADLSGNLYVADTGNHLIRKVTSAGVVTTLAGAAGSSGSADGTGAAARFSSPADVAVDGTGNVYVADTGNDTIRKITPAGAVTTLAGTAGSAGGADGAGAAAQFAAPGGVAVDASGNVYVADTNNNTIRKITPAGAVTTLAGFPSGSGSGDGTGSQALFLDPSGVAVDGNGSLFVTDWGNDTVREVTSAGVVTTLAGSPGVAGSADGTGVSAQFNAPYGIAVDAGGNLYVADSLSGAIRLGAASGAKPGILVQPQGEDVPAGATGSLSVVAQSASPLSYQWFFNGTALAGQTSSTLTIGNFQSGNSGDYTVAVTNSAGTTTSSAARLVFSAGGAPATASAPAASGGGGGGGGAPSAWFLAALALLAAVRLRARGRAARA